MVRRMAHAHGATYGVLTCFYLSLRRYYTSKFWFANNMLGLAFCLEGIEHLSLGSVQIGDQFKGYT